MYNLSLGSRLPGRGFIFRLGLACILLTLLLALPNYLASAVQDSLKIEVIWHELRVPGEKGAILVQPGEHPSLEFACAGKQEPENAKCRVKVKSAVGRGGFELKGDSVLWSPPEEPGNYFLQFELEILPAKKDVNLSDGSGKIPPAEPEAEGGVEPEPAASEVKKVKLAALAGFPSTMLKDGFLNGFELGEYPSPEEFQYPELVSPPPPCFYLLDRGVLGLFISSHFKLGELGYDNRAPIPQYFALDYELVKKLELIHEELEKRGLPSRFHFVGGGFISSKSNRIRVRRNRDAAPLSRHMWGEAADFYIDESPCDKKMDDLNRDGVIDVRDAFVLREIVDELEDSGRCKPGGLGIYGPPRNRRIQVHVDVRGYKARWGWKEYPPSVAEHAVGTEQNQESKEEKPGG